MSNLKRYKRVPLEEIKTIDADENGRRSTIDEEEIQKKEKKIHKLITKCKRIAIEIEEQLEVIDENPWHWLRAKWWFDVKMKILRDNWFKLRSMEADLSRAELFLVAFSRQSVIWKTVGEASKMSLSKWQDVANRATMEIIHLMKETQQHPNKKCNFIVKNFKACFSSFSTAVDNRLLSK